MILVDAIYINRGGGKILLDLLIGELRLIDTPIYYLLDKRIEHEYSDLLTNVCFMKPSLVKRHIFYYNNRNSFTAVLAFANIPPTIRLKCKVFTYFQNVILLNDYSKSSLLLYLKSQAIKFFKSNTDLWIVQSNEVKYLITAKLKTVNNVIVLPIYGNRNINSIRKKSEKDSTNFLYVSTGEKHKNHDRLIDAFVKYSKISPKSTLTVTVGQEYKRLYSKIRRLQDLGVHIINKEFLSKDLLENEYQKADAFIFPSLFESFGLGLIEASQFGLPIASSNLPYVYEVIKPSYVFDPENIDEILISFNQFSQYKNVKSEIRTENKLREIIDLLITS